MNKRVLLFVLLCLVALPKFSTAQDFVNTDSLLRVWNNSNKKDTTRLSSLTSAVKGYYLRSNLDSAKILTTQMRQFASKKKNVRYQGVAYNILGEIEARSGNLDAAIPLFKKALSYAKQTDDILLHAGCLNNLGLVNEWIGNYSASIDYYNRSLKINRADSVKNAVFIAKTNLNIGKIFYELEQFDKALSYFKKAERIAKKTPDDITGTKEYTLAEIWSNTGDALMKLGRGSESMPYYLKGKKVYEKYGDEESLSVSYQGIADSYNSTGRVKESLPYYLKALALVEKFGDVDGIAGMLTNTAAAYFELKNYAKAKELGLRALSLIDQVQVTNPKVAAMEIMIEVYKQEKNYKAASELQDRLATYKQTLVSERVADEVLKSEIQYTFEKGEYIDSLKRARDKEKIALKHQEDLEDEARQKRTAFWIGGGALVIAILLGFTVVQIRTRNRQLKEKNAIIATALDEKAVLLKEISHRVKNNMQMISGLLHLRAKNTKDAKVKDALMDSRARVDSMGLIHQKMYQSDVYDSIDISGYTRDIVRVLINCTPDPTSYDYQVLGKNMMMNLEKGQAIAFVVHEIITNSLKHAWEDDETDKQIELSYRDSKDYIELHYEDNGKGIPEGIDLSKSESLGLKLLHSFATRQLRGSIDLSRGELGGVYILIKIRK